MNGAIIGDIVGSVYEFHTIKQKQFKFFKDKCFITDDTIMTCAVAIASMEYLMSKDYDVFESKVKQYMRELGKKYPEAGYGETFYEWIHDENMNSYNSYGNGAAMRTSSVAYVATTLEECEKLAEIQSRVTHDHEDGIKGAKAISSCIFLARQGKSKEEIRKYIEEKYYTLDFSIKDIRRKYKYDISANGSVPQSIEAFLEGEDFEDCIRNAICLGGDADTLAAMTGAIAEAYFGIPYGIEAEIYKYLTPDLTQIMEKFSSITAKSHLNDVDIPQTIKDIMSKIKQFGYDIYIVGETAINLITGGYIEEYELNTNIPISEIIKYFPQANIEENNENTITRIEINGVKCKIRNSKEKNLLTEISNKRFTIETIALDENMKIIDPLNGIKSLYRKELALVDKEGTFFSKTPIEILKTISTAAKMNFNINENCRKIMTENKELLNELSGEEIYMEIYKILMSDNPSKYIIENKEIIFQLFPELRTIDGKKANSDYYDSDILEYVLEVLERTSKNIYIKFAALFHKIENENTFIESPIFNETSSGTPNPKSTTFKKIADRLNMNEQTRNIVSTLIDLEDYDLEPSEENLRRYLEVLGSKNFELLLDFKESIIRSENKKYRYRLDKIFRIKSLYERLMAISNNSERAINSFENNIEGISNIKIYLELPKIENKISESDRKLK